MTIHRFGSNQATVGAVAAYLVFGLGATWTRSMPLAAMEISDAFHRAAAHAGNIFTGSGVSNEQTAYRG
jgi:hypothetical protein